eukprot:TRINITY_DN3379_c0_g2_i2.p1 TRINITY_DN3379_c0_g2~~TRINITY_DN3379_c0_g2_i2.p1  ORF type:complete len:207 (-),score=19.07 TRINITY_DN3379_c0_g2_i2:124-744(-)
MQQRNPSNVLGKDRDFKEKVSIGSMRKERVVHQLCLDVQFFKSLGIIDYSLLLGIYHVDKPASYMPQQTPLRSPLRAPSRVDFISPIRTNSNSTNNEEDEVEMSVDSITDEHGDASDYYYHSGAEYDEGVFLTPDELALDTGIPSSDGTRRFYVGIIDILQLYDCNKRSERCWKVWGRCQDSAGISVQPPSNYAKRFIQMVSETIE